MDDTHRMIMDAWNAAVGYNWPPDWWAGFVEGRRPLRLPAPVPLYADTISVNQGDNGLEHTSPIDWIEFRAQRFDYYARGRRHDAWEVIGVYKGKNVVVWRGPNPALAKPQGKQDE